MSWGRVQVSVYKKNRAMTIGHTQLGLLELTNKWGDLTLYPSTSSPLAIPRQAQDEQLEPFG